jgi:NAD(P)-dependent dehydrogenase (short-subunit alcohol dehydrogenase family)
MDDLRFDGRVAVVTGSGRGLGREYALLLGERGASVVVNDRGCARDGSGGADTEPAREVADAITAAGGSAVPNWNDVSSEEEAQRVIDAAIENFGRVDILVNNAGISKGAAFPDVDLANLETHLSVAARGAFFTCRAAWPHMVSQQYGRIVNTTTQGIFGRRHTFSYSAAKAAVVSMTRHMNINGAADGIKANVIAPAATTRLAGGELRPEMSPDLAAPMVAFLAHESCPVSGEIYCAGGGRFARFFIGVTEGYVQQEAPTIEDVVRHWEQINDETGYYVPATLEEWADEFFRHHAGRPEVPPQLRP